MSWTVRAGCVGLVATLCSTLGGVSDAATELLPDLVALPASELVLERSGDRTALRFSTTSWNSGSGHLEIVAGQKDRKSGRQKVYQRIYSDTGAHRDVLAGSFVYHAAHDHIHFEDYATYTLQPVNAPGASARSAVKTTFCIMDTDAVNTSLPGAPREPRYTVCGAKVQGMSVGWADRYGRELAGQSIDVTGLPDGDYELRIDVDPRRHILESDKSDNTSRVRLRLSQGTLTRMG